MFDKEYLRSILENTYPKNKRLTKKEMMNLMEVFCKERGLVCKFEYLVDKELTPELISRIEKNYENISEDLIVNLNYNSGRLIKNIYYGRVYVILEKNNFGIANKSNNKLLKITYSKFSEIFKVNRKTTSSNQNLVNFYIGNHFKTKGDLEWIYKKIEEMILN